MRSLSIPSVLAACATAALAGPASHPPDKTACHPFYPSPRALMRDRTDRFAGYLEFVAVVGTAPGVDWQREVDRGCNLGVTVRF
jgi:hypothetical protein